MAKLEAHKAGLSSHMHNVEDCCAQLMEQLKALKEKWCATCVENVKLYKKIFELRKALNPGEDMVSKERKGKEKKRKEKKRKEKKRKEKKRKEKKRKEKKRKEKKRKENPMHACVTLLLRDTSPCCTVTNFG